MSGTLGNGEKMKKALFGVLFILGCQYEEAIIPSHLDDGAGGTCQEALQEINKCDKELITLKGFCSK